MKHSSLRTPGLVAAAAAAAAMVAVGVPLALAAPTAVPPSDSAGYVDSTARCTKPDTAMIFGTTDSSRVAICKTANGYEYRGVRVRDGAKLIVAANPLSNDSFVADSADVTYYVTPTGLKVTSGGMTIRSESWTDFHNPQSPAVMTGSGSPAATSGTAKPTTSGARPTTSGAVPTVSAPTGTSPAAAPVTSAPPLPPPLPAEVGGSTSSSR